MLPTRFSQRARSLRAVATFLALSFTLPDPAFALRTEQKEGKAGLEELRRALGGSAQTAPAVAPVSVLTPAAGLEEVERLKEGELAVSKNGLAPVFGSGQAWRFAGLLNTRLEGAVAGDQLEVDLEGIRFFRRLAGSNTVWAFAQGDLEKVAQLLGVEVRKQAERIQPDELAVSKLGLAPFFGRRQALRLAGLLNTRLEGAVEGDQLEVKHEGIRFFRRRSGPSTVWAFAQGDLEKVAQLLGVEVRKQAERIQPGELAVSKRGLAPVFGSGQAPRLAQLLNSRLEGAAKGNQFEIDLKGIRFFRRQIGSKTVWAFAQGDLEKVMQLLGAEVHKQAERIQPNELAVSKRGLAPFFVQKEALRLAGLLNTRLEGAVAGDQLEVDLEGIRFFRRLAGPDTVWAFAQGDLEKVAQLLGAKAKEDADEMIDRLSLAEVIALLGADPLRLLQYLRLYYSELSPEQTENIVVGALRGLRVEKWKDPPEAHKAYEEKLTVPEVEVFESDGKEMEQPEYGVEGSIAGITRVTQSETFRLEGRAVRGSRVQVFGAVVRNIEVQRDGSFSLVLPLQWVGENRFQVYVFDPQRKTKSRPVSVEVIYEESDPHREYDEVLPPPVIEVNPRETDSHAFTLSGRVGLDAPRVQVVGVYSRKIRVRRDGTFSATIPLPKTGEVNGFEVYTFNDATQQKSPRVYFEVRQTGKKESLEEVFRRLISLRGEVLESIRQDPGRYHFLLQSVEQTLLHHFTYDEKAGLQYLRQLIREEKSPTQKVLLQAVLDEFIEIAGMRFDFKPTPSGQPQRLYFFQKYTIYKALQMLEQSGQTQGVIIASEPGLGKTATCLCLINGRKAVILAPNSVVTTWSEQEEKFFPTANLEVLEGTYRERLQSLGALARPQVVTNVEFTRGMTAQRAKALSRPDGYLVVDEADYLGSASSQQSRGTQQLRAERKILLTATPFKHPRQIRNLLRFLYPDNPDFRSAGAFARAFPLDEPQALNALFLLLQQHTIRIRKPDVFEEYDPSVPLERQSDRLPARVEISPEERGQFTLTEGQAESILELFTNYEGWSKKHKEKGRITEEDRRYRRFKEGFFPRKEALRQIMNDPAYIGLNLESPKHLKMDEIVKEELAKDPHRKVLIFSRYRAQVQEYQKRYAGYGARTYYGGLAANQNGYKIDSDKNILYYQVDDYENFVLDQQGRPIPSDKAHGRPIRALDYERILFQSDPSSRVMIATYDTGALGVTFTAADVVIFDDLAPTYRDQYQAGDRAHRIDNDRKKYNVTYYWLQARYPNSFLNKLPPKIRERYFSMGTFDQVQFSNLLRQGRIFHRIMDGIGSQSELQDLHARFMREKMPFLFADGEAELREGFEDIEPGQEDVKGGLEEGGHGVLAGPLAAGLEEKALTIGGIPVPAGGLKFDGLTTVVAGKPFIPGGALLSVLEPGHTRMVVPPSGLEEGTRIFRQAPLELQAGVVDALGAGRVIDLPKEPDKIPGFLADRHLHSGDVVLLDIGRGISLSGLEKGVAVIYLSPSASAGLDLRQFGGLVKAALREGGTLRVKEFIRSGLEEVMVVDVGA